MGSIASSTMYISIWAPESPSGPGGSTAFPLRRNERRRTRELTHIMSITFCNLNARFHETTLTCFATVTSAYTIVGAGFHQRYTQIS